VGWIASVIAGAAMAMPGDPAPGAPASPPVEFNRDIRPILSDQCYQCHGPDSARRKANLRLDQEASAKADRDGSRAIVPGDLDSSELYRRITAEDPEERMPPAKSGKSLTAAQIDRLRRWIAEGARWQPHWAFIPPRRFEAPRVGRRDWVRNPIDTFILARLEREGLAPSPEAPRGVLLRRLALDLTGLPPTHAELDAFERDPDPDAYEKAVDRLLASPRFGERMAIRWLNAARYADTNGYQTDAPRIMWRWRDWVIEAYNRGLPFDRFTIEQLAGDLLPGATLDQRIATGFNRNHRGNGEGGIIPEEYAAEYVVDRVDTTATVWLGLTIGCARCHSHKFDPISQQEYYRLFAFFNNVPENGRAVKYGNSPPFIPAPTRAQQAQLAALRRRMADLERQVRDGEPELAAAQAAWESSIRARPQFDWSPTEHLVFPPQGSPDGGSPGSPDGGSPGSPDGAGSYKGPERSPRLPVPRLVGCYRDGPPRFTAGPVGSAIVLDGLGYLDAGDRAGFGFYDKFTLSAWIRPSGPHGGTIISRMADQPQGDGYSVVLDHGKVQVNLVKRWLDDSTRVETKGTVPVDRWTHVAITYDGSRVAAGIKVYFDGEPAPLTVLLDELNQSFQTREPLRIGAGGGPEGRFVGAIDEPRVSDRALDPDDIAVLATPESITQIAAIDRARRTHGQAAKLRRCFLATEAPETSRALNAPVDSARADLDALLEQVPTTMVMQEMPVPRPAHVLIRGQYDQLGPRVEPGVPRSVAPWPGDLKEDRLGLARWLVSPANPLTARVAVNRDWQMLFGHGLVRTPDDFGAQGEPPSHPELLDWLATELARSGWDLKAMLRLIVTSASYRQSSRATPEAIRHDPENRLLARGPRLRLPAEMIRDQALALAGLLVERTGGPSVKPYQPPGLWNELADADYVQDHGPSLYRRSLYTFWKRTVPPPAMVAFDAPGRETCVVREVRTDTPLQALNVLNDVTFVEAARAFAERTMKEAGATPEARLAAAFQAATARRPRAEELKVLLDGFTDQMDRFRRDPRAAAALVAVGESAPDPRLDPCELAAYTATTQLILNLDETITKE
jgi:hypothetical protein